MGEQDFGRLTGWKVGDAYCITYPGFTCEYDVLEAPRLNSYKNAYVRVKWRGVHGVRRVYEYELTDKVEKIKSNNG